LKSIAEVDAYIRQKNAQGDDWRYHKLLETLERLKGLKVLGGGLLQGLFSQTSGKEDD